MVKRRKPTTSETSTKSLQFELERRPDQSKQKDILFDIIAYSLIVAAKWAWWWARHIVNVIHSALSYRGEISKSRWGVTKERYIKIVRRRKCQFLTWRPLNFCFCFSLSLCRYREGFQMKNNALTGHKFFTVYFSSAACAVSGHQRPKEVFLSMATTFFPSLSAEEVKIERA